MTDVSFNLGISFLQPSQADKHVFVNEAILRLDVLLGQNVVAMAANTPPAHVNAGDALIIGPNPQGAFAGKAGNLAVWRDEMWWFLVPKAGWRVREVSDGFALWVFDGVSWISPTTKGGGIEQLAHFCLGASRTSQSPFLAVLNDAIWQAKPLASGGSGSLRMYARKEATQNVVSTLFQTGFQGKAEVGLLGDDAYTVKVSDDGADWKIGMSIDSQSAKVSFPTHPIDVQGIDIGRGGGGVATNVALGKATLGQNTSGGECTVLGDLALASNTTGNQNTGVGRYALGSNTVGSANVAVGQIALFFNSSGNNNTAIGQAALYGNSSGDENTALGHASLASNTVGSQNTAVGLFALYANTSGSQNTAIGRYALSTATNFTNCTAIGHNAQVTGSNQVQLGDSATTTFVYGAVQTRSDSRDKIDVRDTIHGLAFIRALRPVDFRWNYREDYKSDLNPAAHSAPEHGRKTASRYAQTRSIDHARKRFHSGLIAQDVQKVMQSHGSDFGGLQDHKRAGGGDVLTLGYDEFIAPLIKAVQEVADRLDRLEARAADMT